MNTEIKSISQMAYTLDEAACYLNNETGEWWKALVELNNHMNNASSEFNQALRKELFKEYSRFKAEYHLISTKEVTEKVVKRLVHISEEEVLN